MKSIREQLTELAKKYGLDGKAVLEAYALRLEQGMTPVDAYQEVYGDVQKRLGSIDEHVPLAETPSMGTGKDIMLPVEETKFEEFEVGVHQVKIVDALMDESETGETDKGGVPIMRKYLRLVFENGKGTHMTGFASAKISTRSKLFDWIKKVTGKAPEIGRTYNVSSLVGRSCRVYMQEVTDETGHKRRRIGDVLPVSEG